MTRALNRRVTCGEAARALCALPSPAEAEAGAVRKESGLASARAARAWTESEFPAVHPERQRNDASGGEILAAGAIGCDEASGGRNGATGRTGAGAASTGFLRTRFRTRSFRALLPAPARACASALG